MRAQLARLTSGEIRYLMMSCPPRHGKTEQNTVRYAAWMLERDPSFRWIVGAYNQGMAEKFSRKILRIVTGRVPLDPDQRSVKDWATTSGGGVRACGVGSGVTGAGANGILIDDPVKSRREAESEAYRRRLWDWFTDDLYTRQEPGCFIALTMTRWHELDLAGQILASEIAPDWAVVNLPALAEEGDPLGRPVGEALCPERYPVEELERRRRLLGRNFYALFQGSPRPAEGNKYKRGWFRYYTRPEGSPDLLRLARDDGRTRTVKLADCRVFATVDLAVTEKTQADYTVIAVWAVTPDSDLVLLDLYREQYEEPRIVDLAYTVFEKWHPGYFAVEANGIGKPIIQNLRRGTVDAEGVRRPGLPVRAIHQHLDKIARASTAIVRVEAGQVYFPAQAPWLEAFEAELLGFPNAAHDDQADVVSLGADDVFWRGDSGIEDEARRDARLEAESTEREARAAEWHDIEAPHWWPGDET